MEMLKSKTTIILIIMILGVSFIGGMDNNQLSETNHQNVKVNA